MTNAKVLALIPGYNEEAAIGSVVREVRTHLPVLVVDDGSRDETSARAREAGAEVLRQEPNQGKGVALRAGFAHALAREFDAVLTLDADGQHDPAEIPKFLGAFSERKPTVERGVETSSARTAPDLIIGARDFSHMPFIRKLSNLFARATFSRAVGQPIRDNQSGYRLISKRLMERLVHSNENGFEFEVEMIVTCIREGMRLEWVPIRTIYGNEKSHIQPISHTLQFLRVVQKARRMMRS